MYYVRKHLNFTWDEWNALPWWQTEAYHEILREDITQGQEPEPEYAPQVVDDELPPSLQRFEVREGPRNAEDLDGFGLQVEQVEG